MMWTPEPAVLASLGISPADVGTAETYPWQDPEMGAAKGWFSLTMSDEDAAAAYDLDELSLAKRVADEPTIDAPSPDWLQRLRYHGVASAAAGAAGLSLWLAPAGVVLVQSNDNQHPLRIEALGPVQTIPDPQAGFYIDLSLGGAALVVGPTGSILVSNPGEALSIQPVRSLAVESFEAVPFPPIRAWLPAGQPEWLLEHVAALQHSGGGWGAAVAAGTAARYGQRAVSAASTVQALLSGQLPPEPARVWARSLPAGQRATIRDLWLASARALTLGLAEFEHGVSNTDGNWPAAWLELCHDRDDLESAKLVLVESGESRRVEDVLGDVDRLGRVATLNVPLTGRLSSPRLLAAARQFPDGWWVPHKGGRDS